MKRKSWIRRLTHASASALALTLLTPTVASAQSNDKLEEFEDTVATQKQLFALFPDLDSSKTRERLATLRKDPASSKVLAQITSTLALPNTKPADIEVAVLSLIKGEKPDSAELTLNAVMRDYYDHYVVGLTEQKSLTAVIVGLEQTDNTLTSAAFGHTPQANRIRLPNRIRR